MGTQPMEVSRCTSDRTANQPQQSRQQVMVKEQLAVVSAFIDHDSGRVLKVLSDGSIVILQGWNNPVQISADTITVPPLTKVSAFPHNFEVSAQEPKSLAPEQDQALALNEDSIEALRHHERRGSSQHVPELPPRAHSAPPRVSRTSGLGRDSSHTEKAEKAAGLQEGPVPELQSVRETIKKDVNEATAKGDLNDRAAGELLLNFANSAAMSSATQGGTGEPGLHTTNKLCSSDQDTPDTMDRSVPGSSRARCEGKLVGKPTNTSEVQVPVASQETGNVAPDSETCGFNGPPGGVSQCAISGVQSAKCESDAGVPESEERRVRDMAADMLVRSLVATIAQQSPAADLPGDDAMMTCLLSFAHTCIGNSAPTESELRAALSRCKERARATLTPSQALTVGAVARAAQSVALGMTKKRGVLPALAEAPPMTSSTKPPHLGSTAQPMTTADTASACTAVNAGLRDKRPPTPNAHQQGPAKAACTSNHPAQTLLAEQMGTPAGPSHAGVQSSDVRHREVLAALRTSLLQNPDEAAQVVLQSLVKVLPGAMKEGAQGRNSTSQQQHAPQRSHIDVAAAAQRAVLQQLLHANPALASQLLSASMSAEAAAQNKATAPTAAQPCQPVAHRQPSPSLGSKEYAAVLMELQQCGASDQLIMHVLQTLLQNQQGAPPQQRSVVANPAASRVAQALGLSPAAVANTLGVDSNVLIAALCRQPMSAQGAVGGIKPWQAAAAAAHVHPQQSQPHSRPAQLSSAAGFQDIKPSASMIGPSQGALMATPDAVGGSSAFAAQSHLAQILSGLESVNRSYAASSQQQPASGS